MKIRSDSVFAKLTEEQIEVVLTWSETMTLETIAQALEGGSEPIRCTIAALSRFLKKARAAKLLQTAQESQEEVEEFAKRADGGKVREATLAATRDRMFAAAVDTNNREALMEMFSALRVEKEKERMLELEDRKVKVAEENAKLGWRKLECQNARSGLKVLPALRELLMDSAAKPEEKVARALEMLLASERVEGRQLLLEPSAPAEVERG